MSHVRSTTKTENASATTSTLTFTTGVLAGHTLIGVVAWESSAASVPTISSIVDSRGNTWTTTPDVSINSDGTVAIAVIRARVTTAFQAGDTVTITISLSRSRWAWQVDEFDDINATTPKNVTATSSGSGTNLTTGTTSATAQAYELVYAAFGFPAGRSPTVPSGWSSSGSSVETSAGSSDRAALAAWKYTSATGTQAGSLTLASSGTWAGAIAAYKATSVSPPVGRVSQAKLVVPQASAASVARVAQVALQAPVGVVGVARVAQVSLKTPTLAGQAPYSGIKFADEDGTLVNATISVAQNGTV